MHNPRRIGLVFDIRSVYARREVSGVIAYARALRLPWIFAGGDESATTWRMLRRWQPDGIVGAVPPGAMRDRILSVVPLAPDPAGAVLLDNVSIGRLAAEHLAERGFRHLAFVGERGAAWSTERADGFRASWKADLTRHPNATFHRLDLARAKGDGWRPAVGELVGWLRTLPRPVGILACRDLRACEVAQACRVAHLRVPEEVAIVGVDNDDLLCELTDPPLSSVSVPWDQVGYHMGAHLHGLLQGRRETGPLPAVLPGGIHVRRSSDITAVADEVVARACRYLRDHAHEPLKVEAVARTAGVSRRGLERRFRRELGRSPHAEIQRLRLERARHMLRETPLPLSIVAERSGWSSVQRFMAVFKARTGQTPGRFRSSGRVLGVDE
jgi:LacI family transcriptional regulator